MIHVQVAAKAPAKGAESRQQAIVEVMVDLLLELEMITVHQGLVYVLDELESYPVSGKVEQGIWRGSSVRCVALMFKAPCLSFSWSSWLLNC